MSAQKITIWVFHDVCEVAKQKDAVGFSFLLEHIVLQGCFTNDFCSHGSRLFHCSGSAILSAMILGYK